MMVTCPWHKADFSLETGRVLAGVSPRDVEVFRVRVDGESIFIARQEEKA
jgi:nitrite reductase/ring-hydroxylating ferredoxin subunit